MSTLKIVDLDFCQSDFHNSKEKGGISSSSTSSSHSTGRKLGRYPRRPSIQPVTASDIFGNAVANAIAFGDVTDVETFVDVPTT